MDSQLIWSHCNTCSRRNKHDVLYTKEKRWDHGDQEEFEVSSSVTYRMIECRGCESISMHMQYWHSEVDLSDEVDQYPPRVSRKLPSWQDEIPNDIALLLSEIYTALHADSSTLAMMGARAAVDMYMNAAVGDVGGFAKKLDMLVSKGHLSLIDRNALQAALEAGHAAAHRGHCPTAVEVNQVMDIVENLLQKFALNKAAASLSKGTPKRRPL